MHSHPLLRLAPSHHLASLLLAFMTVVASAQVTLRPYLQQVGSQENVLGMSVARNGHTFMLLSNSTLVVAGPDQILRPPLTHSALTNAKELAVSPSGEPDDTLIPIYVATGSGINKIVYNTEERTLAATTSATFAFPSDKQYFPTAITVAPDKNGEPGAIFLGGQTKPTGSIATGQKNFIMKFSTNLAQQGSTREWGVPSGTTGSLSSDGVNNLHCLTTDADGDVYVGAQWPSVYNTTLFNYFELWIRSGTWNISTLGGLTGQNVTIQTSVKNYYQVFYWWFIPYNTSSQSLLVDAENRTGYITKFNGGTLAPSAYSHTTNQVPHYFLWATGQMGNNISNFSDIRVTDSVYAIGNWQGTSNYTGEILTGSNSDIQVIKLSKALALEKKAKVKATGASHPGYGIDVNPDTNDVFVTGVTEDGTNQFYNDGGNVDKTVSGRGLFVAKLNDNLTWTVDINKSNSPAPSAFKRTRLCWNVEATHAQMAGTFTAGQLSLGLPSRPALVPTGAVAGNVNYYALAGSDGKLVNQINVVVRSEFVDGSQIMTRLGDNPEVPLTNFDPITREGAVGLLSDSSGASVTISVPANVYFNSDGAQVYPTFSSGNEVAPDNAVSRHRCTGFSVSGEATTGATNTYTFAVTTDTKVIFNWHSEHALQIFSEVTNDLGLSVNTAALGNPGPEVRKHWVVANEPTTAFIDNAALEPAVYGKRYRVTGFDATGSVLERGSGLPALPPGRVLMTATGDISSNGLTVTLAQPVGLEVGWLVTGAGVPANTTIVATTLGVNNTVTSFTLSQAATQGTGIELRFENTKIRSTVTSTLTLAGSGVTLDQPTGVQPGWLVSGAGLQPGTKVATVTDSTHLTLTKPTIPLRRSARTTAPLPMPVVDASTVLNGTATATIDGSASVNAGMLVAELSGKIAAGTSVATVVDNPTTISTTLTNGTDQATIAYREVVVVGAPVSGTGTQPNTFVKAVTPTPTVINAQLTSGTNQAKLPATTILPLNIPVIDPSGTPAIPSSQPGPPATPPTFLTALDPTNVTETVIISGNSNLGRITNAQSPNIFPGAVVNGTTGLFAGTNVITVTGRASASNPTTATYTNNSNSLSVTSATGIRVGDVVTGTHIPANTTVTAVSGTTITISANTTAANGGSAQPVSFAYTNLQFSAAVLGSVPQDKSESLVFTNEKVATFSNNASASGSRNLNFITTLTLALSRTATATGAQNLAYIFSRTLTLSTAALGSGEQVLSYSFPPDSSATSVRVTSIEGLQPLMQVSGPGIPAGTTITSIQAPNTVVISQAPTQSGSFMLEFFNPRPQLTYFSNYGSYAFFDQAARQQVPQWIMSGPATINYRWITQFHVMVSTTVQTAQDFPEVRKDPAVPVTADQPGYGSGEHWFDIGSTVFVGGRFGGGSNSRQLNGWLNATVPPFPSDSGAFDFANTPNVFIPAGDSRQSPNAFFYTQVTNLLSPVRVLWNYGGTIYRASTVIGSSVDFDTANPVLPGPAATVGTPLFKVKNLPPDRAQVVEGPSGSSPDQMSVWDNLDKKLYPLRPGKTLYEYGDQSDPLIVEVTSTYPTPIYHITHPDMPGVLLDPNAQDRIAFNQLTFTSGNATADGGNFLSTQSGYSVLLFSRRPSSDLTPANGDLTKETLMVQVVQTKQWDDDAPAAKTGIIGERLKLELPLPSTDVLDTGFVVHKNARYNAGIYDRSRILGSGPIIPVNRQFTGLPEDELVVIWFSKPDITTGIAWTNSVCKYDLQWPANPPRIVIASRLGSEGKNAAGADQTVYTRDKFANVVIYNQPDREQPGYNPNEEHALIAPSLKFADQANPPPSAYALQMGNLNVTHDPALTVDEDYSSDPYVLVQYTDLQANEAKMAVYAIENEDSSAELNPYIDPRNNRAYRYTFDYDMTVGEPVVPPYPLLSVIGLNPPSETFGINTTPIKAYWEDYNGVAYAAGQGAFNGHFYYRLTDAFWGGEGDDALTTGDAIPFGNAAEGGRVQLDGTVVQNVTATAYDGSVSSPAFARVFTAAVGKENPVFTPVEESVYDPVTDSFRTESTNKFQVQIDTDAPVDVEFTGTTAQDFIDAVNSASMLSGELEASLTATGLIRLTLPSGSALALTDGLGTPLVAAGFGSGTLVPDSNTFFVDIGDGDVLVSMNGFSANEMINAILTAFPAGEVSATVSGDKVRLLVNGPYALTLTDGIGEPLTSAGFGAGDGQPFSPTSTTTMPAGFQLNSQFVVNFGDSTDYTVTVTGSTAQDFINAINNYAAFADKLTASLTSGNRIRLSLGNVPEISLNHPDPLPVGKLALAAAGLPVGRTIRAAQPVHFRAKWPANPPVLKAGETLTYAGGEYRADNPSYPGLPGVIGWAVGEVIFDSLNPAMRTVPSGGLPSSFGAYTARLIAPLEPRSVVIPTEDATGVTDILQPSKGLTKVQGLVWKFTDIPASLSRRLFYDPLNRKLGMNGYVNDKTLGDSTLTAAPPPVYVLEPNVLTAADRDALLSIPQLASNLPWRNAVNELYRVCRNPNEVTNGGDTGTNPYYAGLRTARKRDASTGEIVLDDEGEPEMEPNSAEPDKIFGPGLALVPGPAFMNPANLLPESYVTLVENNDEDIGGPVTLRVVKVVKNSRFRGAIKTITSDNVFSEQLTLRHSGDFGGNADDLVYQWYYREEDGTETAVPPTALWNLFADSSDNEPRGLGMNQIELKGNPILLLADQLFFVRYRHKEEVPAGGPNSTNWAGTLWEAFGSEWAGAANSRPGAYQPQLAMGWVKRVLDRVNPYEARFTDFRNNSAPGTYVSMIQQAGQRYEGPVALNPDKDVVENVGLIELYETILDRGRGLSIDLSTPVVTGGINNALLLAATRVADLYMLLGNEAFSDAQDPTIGFGSGSADFGSAAGAMFSFQNQLPSLLDEELALLRGVPKSYGRPAYNRLFWNFTKSEGEVAYALNYNLSDITRDGFIDENDARVFFPQAHGDAWGHYLSALKSQYRLLKHPYFNWVSRSEFYNLLDVVVEVDYYDERKFADAASARAKAGAEIVDLTYRSRYVEDPDGQWQGYSDTDTDRAWGVDGWAKRAGQGAYLDWVTANALIPAEDATHTGIQKVDRTTVTAIQNISAQLAKIQSTEDNSSAGLNPLGLSADVVPMDFDPAAAGPGGASQFEQISHRAETAIYNAFHIFENANQQSNRLRSQGVAAADFAQQTFEQDRDYRNRLIEIFGTPYEGQIGPGELYPTGYTGPDLALFMYVDVNDLNDDTVPPPSEYFIDVWNSFPQMSEIDPVSIQAGTNNLTITAQYKDVFSNYFLADVITGNFSDYGVTRTDVFSADDRTTAFGSITGVTSYFNGLSLDVNMPISAAGYTFRAPEEWGKRAAPGELQAVISELVQAQAVMGYAVGNYDYLILQIQQAAQALRAQHGLSSANVQVKDHVRKVTIALNSVILGLNVVKDSLEASEDITDEVADAIAEFFPKVVGLAVDPTSGPRGAAKVAGFISKNIVSILKVAAGATIGAIELGRDDLGVQTELEIEKYGYSLEIQQKLKEIEMQLWNEAAMRVDVFQKLEAMRQISDRYRAVLKKGMALVEERADFNRQTAGAGQALRYQDMGFRVFRNDSLQKYRAAFDLAQRYTYLAAKAYDYETNLAPNDPASAQPMLQEIVRNRVIGDWFFGLTSARGGISEQLVKLRSNYEVLKGRMGLNNPQVESTGFSLRAEQARTDAAGWRQMLVNSRKADLWEVPEFRRFCRPPQARKAGRLPGLVIPFSTETVFGRNFFGRPLGAGDSAFNPTNFANKIAAAGVKFEGYPVASLAATPQVYLVPVGLDVMTIPNSLDLETRQWNVLDQALPVPFPISASNLANTDWVPAVDGLNGQLAAIRRFSSFRAGITAGEPPLATDTRLAGRSVWNTRWLLIIPGGSMLNDGSRALDIFTTRVTDIKLHLDTYGYSGN